jgi:hypothetical protein
MHATEAAQAATISRERAFSARDRQGGFSAEVMRRVVPMIGPRLRSACHADRAGGVHWSGPV